ncbi:Mitotic-spindle organizing protein 1 [Camponotus japonicus]
MAFPQSHQQELIELAEITGISAVPGVFRIILELLALQVSPEDIYILLKQISTRSLSQQTINEGAHISTEK